MTEWDYSEKACGNCTHCMLGTDTMQQWKSSDTAFASEGITACCMLEFPRHAPLVSVHGGCEHFSPRTVTPAKAGAHPKAKAKP